MDIYVAIVMLLSIWRSTLSLFMPLQSPTRATVNKKTRELEASDHSLLLSIGAIWAIYYGMKITALSFLVLHHPISVVTLAACYGIMTAGAMRSIAQEETNGEKVAAAIGRPFFIADIAFACCVLLSVGLP